MTNSQRNVRETGQYFCLDKRQKERFGDVDSWVITTEKTGGVVDSDEIQNKTWRENERGSRVDSCKEERRHAIVVGRISEDRDKRKLLSPVVSRCGHMRVQKGGEAEEEEKTVIAEKGQSNFNLLFFLKINQLLSNLIDISQAA